MVGMTDAVSSIINTRLISFFLVVYSIKFLSFLFQEIKTNL